MILEKLHNCTKLYFYHIPYTKINSRHKWKKIKIIKIGQGLSCSITSEILVLGPRIEPVSPALAGRF